MTGISETFLNKDKVRKANQYQYSATIACFAVEIFRGMQVGFKLQEFHYRFLSSVHTRHNFHHFVIVCHKNESDFHFIIRTIPKSSMATSEEFNFASSLEIGFMQNSLC